MWSGLATANIAQLMVADAAGSALNDARLAAALAATMSTVASAWETETLLVTITGSARANWILNDWPLHDPLHWRMVLAGRLGEIGQDLRAVSLYEEGEQGIVVELRVSRGQADEVLRALGQAYPDLTWLYADFRRPTPRASLAV